MTKVSQKLLTRVGKYSVLTGASLAVFSGCGEDQVDDPLIEYNDFTDVNLAPPVNTDGLSVLIDLDDDGIDDFEIAVGNAEGVNDYGQAYDLGYAFIEAAEENKVLTREEFIDILDETAILAKGLSNGDNIGASESTWANYGYLGLKGITYDEPINVGDFVGATKFIGVSFEIDGNQHYGWIRVTIANDGKSLTVKDYAYHKTPDTALEAGAE
jgi:hypothetical protein